jgi:phospholipid/cholesterol/gamma-HCH transport system ATP-binding protein
MAETTIRFERVTKTFGAQRVLDDISLAIPRGTVFCLLGRSGTGKSVALKHVIGLLLPTSGHVFVEGEDVTTLDRVALARLRQRVGFLFQHAALFDSLTVGENVAFPLRRHRRDLPDQEIRRIVVGKLAAVGLEADYDKMPGALSGGMRKRAGLARAMALDPPILLVDEPTAGLDPLTSAEIDTLLLDERRRAGTTLLVVTHNIPSARAIGYELAFLHEGHILARGTAAELERHSHPLVRAFMTSEGAG